jgi:hypothetical protein
MSAVWNYHLRPQLWRADYLKSNENLLHPASPAEYQPPPAKLRASSKGSSVCDFIIGGDMALLPLDGTFPSGLEHQ